MYTTTTMLAAIPQQKLSGPGRAFLEDLLARSAGWSVAVEQIGGDWFLVEGTTEELAALTPIEVFDLEDGALL